MIELISDEIRRNFPHRDRLLPENDHYVLHCSEIFNEFLRKSFIELTKSQGLVSIIPEGMDINEAKFSKYFSHIVGWIEIKIDEKVGYRIEKL